MSVRKSLVWLLLATIAEVPPTVSLAIFFGHPYSTHYYFTT